MGDDTSLVTQIRNTTRSNDLTSICTEVERYLDTDFSDLDVLLNHARPSTRPSSSKGPQKRKRTLKEEILYWERKESIAAQEV